MRIAAIQLSIDGDEPGALRAERAHEAIHAEARGGAELVVLPEMWLPGFFGFPDYPAFAEPLDGLEGSTLSGIAKDAGVYLCAGSLVEKAPDGLYNTTVLFGPAGERIATYRKMHLYGYGSAERATLSPGTEIVTTAVDGMTIGLSTCYDLRFPELYRAMVDRGAELFVIVAAWPFPRVDAWRCLARARAIENQAAVVGCNSSGRQGAGTYAGSSCAFDAWGTPLGELDDRPGVLHVDVDAAHIRAAREDFPALRDRVLGV